MVGGVLVGWIVIKDVYVGDVVVVVGDFGGVEDVGYGFVDIDEYGVGYKCEKDDE